MRKLYLIIMSMLILLAGSTTSFALENGKEAPINPFSQRGFISDWLLLGPFPKENSPAHTREGFDTDFLISLGGEKKARLNPATTIKYKGLAQFSTKLARADENGIIDFEQLLGTVDHSIAYAFSMISASEAQSVVCLFGSDDGAKVWINGEKVHEIYLGRGITAGEDTFRAQLKKGLNTILIKVEDRVRQWGFCLEMLSRQAYAKHLEKVKQKEDFNRFLQTGLVFKNRNTWNNFFTPGEFPELEWEKPYLTQKVLGEFPLHVRWFDKNAVEVKRADKPGRYGYVAEGFAANGLKIRRGGTVYCMPPNWVAWGERPSADLQYIPVDNIDRKVWLQHRQAIAEFTGRTMLLSILKQQEGAVLMSYIDALQENDNASKLLNTPLINDHDFHLKIKRKLLGVEDKWPQLKMPQKVKSQFGPVLRSGSAREAGVKPGTADNLRKLCHLWYQESGEPFITLIARNGVIILHEAFGKTAREKVTIESKSEIASITKLLTGVLFAQFLDQGLIGLDDPVGNYFPDFPVSGEKNITLRMCFTHTSGLWGHEEWGGMHNPWLENVIANLLPQLQVQKYHEYNGMGYDLAGKVMEIVSGKSIFRLMREQLFDPLQMHNTILEEDLAFGCHSNAGELARIGQMLLNKGTYGEIRFFSPETYEKILPKKLNKFYPAIKQEWGVGITWMRQQRPQSDRTPSAAGRFILSKNMFGHGSATSAILRIDPDNKLVIAQTRRRGGKFYEKYLTEMLLILEKGMRQ